MNNLSRIMGRPLSTDAYQINALFIRAKESMIDGLKYYIECGVKLKSVKDSLPHGKWLPWLKEKEEILEFGIATAQRIIQVSNTALARHYSESEATTFLRQIWGHNHRALGTGENDWHTPIKYVKAACEVMGCIDLDPASDLEAQKVVKAERFYDKEADGLRQTWQGRIWLNPPWSNPQPWLERQDRARKSTRNPAIPEEIFLIRDLFYNELPWNDRSGRMPKKLDPQGYRERQ